MADKLATFIKTEYTGRQVPDFRVGDVIKVHQLVPDIKAHEVGQKLSKTAKAAMKAAKKKEVEESSRIQIFEGIVIARKHGKEPGASFTVRKIASGNVGVEKIFPLYSPLVTKIEVVSRPKARRAKLYFLREQVGKRARKFGTGVSVDQNIMRVSDIVIPGADLSAEKSEEVSEEVVTDDIEQPSEAAAEKDKTESTQAPEAEASEEKTE